MKHLVEAIKYNQTITLFCPKQKIEPKLMEYINESLEENKIMNEFKNVCKDNKENDAILMINKHRQKCYPVKASNNIKNEDAIYWILKNKMTKVAKEMTIKCDVMKRLYYRGNDIEDLIMYY